MVKKSHLILILISSVVLLFGTIGCTKKKFLKYNTLLELVVPENCQDCILGVIMESDNNIGEYDATHLNTELTFNTFIPIEDYGNKLSISYDANNPVQEITINWSEYLDINPSKKLRFILADDFWYTIFSSGAKIIDQKVKKIRPRKVYRWDPTEGTFKKTGEKTESNNSSSNNPLSGKWSQVNACSNSAGEKNYFNFSSPSSGTIGQIDCNNSCGDGGVYTQFDYTVSGSYVSITPKSVSDFCGTSSTLTSPSNVLFSISGNVLTLGGQNFEKQ